MARNFVSVDFQLSRCQCGMSHQHVAMIESVISGKDRQNAIMACMRLNWSWDGYQNNLSREVFRGIKKCRDYPVAVFDPYFYSEDFASILGARQQFTSAHMDIDTFIQGNYPSDSCKYHWRKWYGAFDPPHADGPRRRLLAFVNVSRLGNFVVYSHPAAYPYLMPMGIMTRLHLGICERLLDKTDEHHRGLEFLIYGEFFGTKKSLLKWKKKVLFGPKQLKLVKKEDYGACYDV